MTQPNTEPEKSPLDSSEEPPNDRPGDDGTTLRIVAGVAVLVLLGASWTIFVVRDAWWTVLLPIGMLALASYAWYRHKHSTMWLVLLTLANLAHAWLAFFTRAGFVAVLIVVLYTAMLMRTAMLYWRGTEREAILESFRKLDEPVKVNDRLALKLNADERYVLATQYHVIDSVGWFAAMVVWVFAIQPLIHGWFNYSFWTSLLVTIVGLVPLTIKPFLWHREILCLTTNERLFLLKGFLKQSEPATSVSKITDQTPIKPRMSTILSWLRIIKAPYGYYIVESAGQDQALTKIGPIPFIDAFARAVTQMMTPPPDSDD